jgi:hypothetical protein
MNKRRLHHSWKTIRRIRPIYFLILAVIFGVIASFALRSNYVRMTELREAVYAADRDNGDVQTALNELQAYVISHMNTSLNTGKTGVYPPIQLQNTYQRLVQAQAASQQGANGDLYTRAQAYCQQQNASDFSGRNRVPCIEKYVQENGSATNMGAKIDPSLYQFDFVAARWSPDLAGWSLVAAVLFLLAAIVKFIIDLFIKRSLR